MVLIGWSLGCSGPEDRPTTGEFVPGQVPGTGSVVFHADAGAQVHVDYGPVDADLRSTGDVPASAGAIRLAGLKTGQRYRFTVVASQGGASDPFEATIAAAEGVPAVTVEGAPACDSLGYALFTWQTADASGVAIVDRDGDYVWSMLAPSSDRIVDRARATLDGTGVRWLVVSRDLREDVGQLVRIPFDGSLKVETRARDAHDDFLELPDGRLAWLAHEYSQPSDGGAGQLLATDAIDEADEGSAEETPERRFSTLSDYSLLPGDDPDPEGLAGRTLEGCDEFGHASSLAYRASDDAFFLVWELRDTLLVIDQSTGELRRIWGGPHGELAGDDPFSHPHLSDVDDDGVLMFDNRSAGEPSRLVEYAFDDASYAATWELPQDAHFDGPGDLRAIDGCDDLVASWPTPGRIAELGRDGAEVWSVAVDATVARVEALASLGE